MNDKIKELASYHRKLCGTSDPYVIADYLKITIIKHPLDDIAGCYMFLKRRQYIFINSDIESDSYLRVVMAHEIGHAILHKYDNCAFIQGHTLLLTSRTERQANIFAAYLLIDDDMLRDFSGCTREQFCECMGYPEELLDLRLK